MAWMRKDFILLSMGLAYGAACGGSDANLSDGGANDAAAGDGAGNPYAATNGDGGTRMGSGEAGTGCYRLLGTGSATTCNYQVNCGSSPDASAPDSGSADALTDDSDGSFPDSDPPDAPFNDDAAFSDGGSPDASSSDDASSADSTSDDASAPESSVGSCPAAKLYGCCVFTVDGGADTAVCYYSPNKAAENRCQFNDYEGFPEFWQSFAP